ncbi:MAG: coiled-coil domain-containing protein [Acetivibrionales bacterium]|jgi:peptidoglycan hydrolase CwlO-like protein
MAKLKRSMTGLILILCFTLIFIAAVSGQTDTISNPRQTLEDISMEEKAVLEELFFLSQEIDEMSRTIGELQHQSESLEKEISMTESNIDKRQEEYDKQLKILEQVLIAYQRNGPASSLEILLSAENLTDFIKRLNVIRTLSGNTGELLQSLKEEKNILVSERETLISNKILLENNREDLQRALTEKLQLKQEQEIFLNSLSNEKMKYQDQLDRLDQAWSEAKALFSDIPEEFSRVFYGSNLSMADFNISFDFLSVKGSVTEDLINEIVEKDSKLPKMVFDINPERIQMEIPDIQLLLCGTMAIENESTLKFEVTEGTFYGMGLEKASIEELFRDGYLLIDFSKLIGEITLQSVEMKDGFIEYKIKSFF